MNNRLLDPDYSKFNHANLNDNYDSYSNSADFKWNLMMSNSFADEIAPIKKEGGATEEHSEPVDLNETKEEQIHTGDKRVDIVVDVGNRSVESANYKKNDTEEMLTVLNRCIKMSFDIDKRFAGEEDIGGFVSNGLYGIVNVVGHIVSNAANLLFRGWRDFKRSELNAYLSSNVTLMSRINDESNYKYLDKFKLYIPEGMAGKYPDAFKSLVDYLDMIDMRKTVFMAQDSIDLLAKLLRNKRLTDFDHEVNIINAVVNNQEFDKKFKETEKYFTTKKNCDSEFQIQFASMSDFAEFVDELRSGDEYLRDVSTVYDTIRKIENSLAAICDDKNNLSKQDISHIAGVIRTLAVRVDNYATCINDMNRLQHNIYENIKAIRTKLKY